MEPNAVYQFEDEVDRLALQNQLFEEHEAPVYGRILGEYPRARVLDVGSNSGVKAVHRFSGDGVWKVVGLEFHSALAEEAQRTFGDERFTFYGCDVEDPQFPGALSSIMATQGIGAFDVIHISLVLLHLKDPVALLRALRGVLAPQGQLLIVEAADHLTRVVPDEAGLCAGFVEAVAADPYAGDRGLGAGLPDLLTTCGYHHIAVQPQRIEAGPGELAKKQAIFQIFCSFVGEDALLTGETEPWARWVNTHWAEFEALVTHPETQVTGGFLIVTCRPLGFYLSPMEHHEIPAVCRLFDQCAGENLYTPAFVEAMFHLPNHYFNLLRTQDGEIAGYSYCNVVDISTVAEYAKLPLSAFGEIGVDPTAKIRNLQATGVAERYRKIHLSEHIIDWVLKTVEPDTMAFGLCWRPCNKPPEENTAMENTLLSQDFVFLTQSFDVWADVSDLVCPYCEGTCHCSATAYYRPNLLQGGTSVEA